ncbi:hypothetical protein O181_073818 [Austropuccinia psidii MF-1]|uniref:Uncharacterized protein n=1 Tax=Austropuccinia psidii MF-1 TaxID=1389203 RepID=A0A9Q3F9V3_9BASI|nr:hypothetical protein [Austropuccinia psidii MF-1]
MANDSEPPRLNTSIILSLRRIFAMFKKLGIEANKLKGLLAQATCWEPPTLNQLITAAILSKGDEKPSSTFVGQKHPQTTSGCDPLLIHGCCLRQVRRAGHWRADCPHTRGVANPNPRPPSPTPFRPMRPATPDRCSQQGPGTHYHCESVSQVQFVERDASNKVLIDTGAFIHLSGAMRFATCMRSVSPFCIFFANSNSSVLISQTTTLELPVNGGLVLVHDVAFSDEILGTIFPIGCLCTAGVVPIFDNLKLSLFVSGFLVTTTFNNNCWWLDILAEEGTKRSAAASPSCILSEIEMHPISKPTSTSLSSREGHERLGHACDKMIILFLKQHVPAFDTKCWQPF